ncbi:hypothetical protein [Flavobacterium oreochromis]|uniref:VWA domain-containing protein n=1 Tax=Flavobacterium oreochromis TaxID=2906078 RepID=A0ABW8P525_9FLAO
MKLIKKIIFCILILCVSNSMLAQELTDSEIGLDVERIVQKLQERGLDASSIEKSIQLTREKYKKEYVESRKEDLGSRLDFSKEPEAISNTNNKSSAAVVDIPPSEREALRALYYATDGPNWNIPSSLAWKVDNPTVPVTSSNGISGWYGVQVMGGHVVGITLLCGAGRSCTIPDLSALQNLEYLELNGFTFTGNLNGIQNLINLKWLMIKSPRKSNFQSFTPIFNLVNLKELSLINCGFNTTTVPSKLGLMTNLEKLELRNGNLNLGLEVFGNLTNLISLILDNNNFSGSIPSSFQNLIRLEALSMRNNSINDISNLSSIITLKFLDFIYNNISIIPNNFSNLAKLEYLDFFENKLSGNVPPFFQNLHLLHLDITRNYEINGIIPRLTFDGLPISISTAGRGREYSWKNLYLAENKFRFVDFANQDQYFRNALNEYKYNDQALTDTPKIENKTVGQSVTLTMCEDGRYTDKDTFQWFKKVKWGSPVAITLESVNNRTLTLPNLRTSDAGDYYCISKHPQITNPAIATQNLILERHPITLNVTPCSNTTPIKGEILPHSFSNQCDIDSFTFKMEGIDSFDYEKTWSVRTADGFLLPTYPERADYIVLNEELRKYKQFIVELTVTDKTNPCRIAKFIYNYKEPVCVNSCSVKGTLRFEDCIQISRTEKIKDSRDCNYVCGPRTVYLVKDTSEPIYKNSILTWIQKDPQGNIIASLDDNGEYRMPLTFTTVGNNTVELVITNADGCKSVIGPIVVPVIACPDCEVNFNFNFKLPSYSGSVLSNKEREELANGLIDFVNANMGKKLYLTTYDDVSTGARATAIQKNFKTAIPPAFTNTSNETQASDLLRFQATPYNDTFKNIISSTDPTYPGILANPLITKKMDVSFFVISEENFSDIAALQSAYQQLLNSNKTKKIFFILLYDGVYKNTATNSNLTSDEFVSKIIGRPAVFYNGYRSVSNSDFIVFFGARREMSYKSEFTEFLKYAYKESLQTACVTESCTTKNPNTPVIKQFFIGMVNHLKKNGANVNNGYPKDLDEKDFFKENDIYAYPGAEFNALMPYITDNAPKIYNYKVIKNGTNNTVSFSFSEKEVIQDGAEALNQDVYIELGALDFASLEDMTDIDLSSYLKPDAYVNQAKATFGNTEVKITFRHIDFCKDIYCKKHVAVVVDESGSISEQDAENVKYALRKLVQNQAFDNDKYGSNVEISFIGLSDQDDDIREDHVIDQGRINKDLIQSDNSPYYNWINKYRKTYFEKRTGVSRNSDYWNSGLRKALELSTKPDIVLLITDGCQTANLVKLQETMKGFDNHQINKGKTTTKLPHLFVMGIEDGFYVDAETDLASPSSKFIAPELDPNQNPELSKKAVIENTDALATNPSSTSITQYLKKSLRFLLGYGFDANNKPIFPYAYANNFSYDTFDKTMTDYYASKDFDFIVEGDYYLSNGLRSDNDIAKVTCGPYRKKDVCDNCITFNLEPEKSYILSAWVKEEVTNQILTYPNPGITIKYLDGARNPMCEDNFEPTGDIIEGWQRIFKRFTVPPKPGNCSPSGLAPTYISIELVNKGANPVYFDDIRIHPIDGSMKSYIYDPITLKLMSELDENNYGTYYEYDNEGGLVRVKKETARGVKTIQETRSSSVIKK